MRWFRGLFSTQQIDLGAPGIREFQTLCMWVDQLLKGKQVEALDMLTSRLRASLLAHHEQSWRTAHNLELLAPVKTAGILDLDEEEFLRKVSIGEIKMAHLLEKLKTPRSN
jgi:hypothetical protein